MAKKYEKPTDGDPVNDWVRDIIEQHHEELKILRVDVLFVTDTNDPHPLRHHGAVAAALAKVVETKWRAQGCGDVEIQICRMAWEDMEDDNEKMALLDHELTHFEIRHDNLTGAMKIDTNGRPCVGTKPHDVQFGWFADVAKRWGRYSPEVRQARRLADKYGQTFFPFMKLDGNAITADMVDMYAGIKEFQKEHGFKVVAQ